MAPLAPALSEQKRDIFLEVNILGWTKILHHLGKQKNCFYSTLELGVSEISLSFPSHLSYPIGAVGSSFHVRALRDSRATPNPLERCYDWCCVVKRPFRKSDAGSAKRSTLQDSFQTLFLDLLLLIQSKDRYGPNGNPRPDALSRSWGRILSSNFFENIRSELPWHVQKKPKKNDNDPAPRMQMFFIVSPSRILSGSIWVPEKVMPPGRHHSTTTTTHGKMNKTHESIIYHLIWII